MPRHSRNDIRLLDDSTNFVENGLAHGHLLPNHCVVLVVGVVCVPKLAAAGELELHELVPELTLVAHTGREKRAHHGKGRIAAYLRPSKAEEKGRGLRRVPLLRDKFFCSRCPEEAVTHAQKSHETTQEVLCEKETPAKPQCSPKLLILFDGRKCQHTCQSTTTRPMPPKHSYTPSAVYNSTGIYRSARTLSRPVAAFGKILQVVYSQQQ